MRSTNKWADVCSLNDSAALILKQRSCGKASDRSCGVPLKAKCDRDVEVVSAECVNKLSFSKLGSLLQRCYPMQNKAGESSSKMCNKVISTRCVAARRLAVLGIVFGRISGSVDGLRRSGQGQIAVDQGDAWRVPFTDNCKSRSEFRVGVPDVYVRTVRLPPIGKAPASSAPKISPVVPQ